MISPANASFLGIPLVVFSVIIPVAGVALFSYIMARRLAPIVLAAPDNRFDRLLTRAFHMVKFAVGQYRHPRYFKAGIIHIGIFAGFMIISLHSLTLAMEGIKAGWHLPGLGGTGGVLYGMLKDVLATVVLVAALAAIYRRTIEKPDRYKVPEHLGKDHTSEAVFVLLMISGLMISDTFYEGSLVAAARQQGLETHFLIPFTLNWMSSIALGSVSLSVLQKIHYVFYYCHEIIFFSFLCFLPNGKHFHVITSLPNVFFAKLDKGTVKPVRWDVPEEKLDDLESFGVKKFEDFTWKHILDFYSCADCGRCSDRCPANRVGRPLSPRFISIKARDFAFKNYPLKGGINKKQEPLIGQIYTEDEIWSCTTCGACEEECPLFIEYIDKMVDMRRGMVDEGMVPQSLQKPLMALWQTGQSLRQDREKAGRLGQGQGIRGPVYGQGAGWQGHGRHLVFCGQHHFL